MHGHSTETDFIYVTTGSLSGDQLKVISDEVGNSRTLLICCKAFMTEETFVNLTLKKIPQAILNKCEWDHDDYSFSLNVLPDDETALGDLRGFKNLVGLDVGLNPDDSDLGEGA